VPSFGPRMVCTKLGTIGADVGPVGRNAAGNQGAAVAWSLIIPEASQRFALLAMPSRRGSEDLTCRNYVRRSPAAPDFAISRVICITVRHASVNSP
jgi:hypothetical protein